VLIQIFLDSEESRMARELRCVGWQRENERGLGAINDLIADLKRPPFKGLGNGAP
jgi:Txe/YoeB family toxin of Txe-Axe toxin-antitoxin module